MFLFRLPDIGEGITEGEIVSWKVKIGQEIKEGEDLVEVMTDKVTVQIPSPVSGKVKEILVHEGTVAKVRDVLIKIDDGQEEERTNLEGEREVSAAAPSSPVQGMDTKPPSQSEVKSSQSRILATPAVRKLAAELGVPLEKVTPTGPGGRVLPTDVRRYLASQGEGQKLEVPQQKITEEEILEPKGLRRIIFEKMSRSKSVMPHFTIFEILDISNMLKIRKDLASRGSDIGFTPFFLKVASAVLKEFPKFNAIYDEKGSRYLLKKYYNLGFAVDTSAGLTVAVVKDVDQKDIVTLSAEVADLAERARRNQLKLPEVQNSTFTVSNVGSIGGILSTPIINYPEVAILAVHRVPGQDFPGLGKNRMLISMSCDHRIIDGADAARFITRFKELFEKMDRGILGMEGK